MDKYELYEIAGKTKGLQIHIFEKKESCIRMLYLDPKTFKPIQNQHCPESLEHYIDTQKEAIKMKIDGAIAV